MESIQDEHATDQRIGSQPVNYGRSWLALGKYGFHDSFQRRAVKIHQ